MALSRMETATPPTLARGARGGLHTGSWRTAFTPAGHPATAILPQRQIVGWIRGAGWRGVRFEWRMFQAGRDVPAKRATDGLGMPSVRIVERHHG